MMWSKFILWINYRSENLKAFLERFWIKYYFLTSMATPIYQDFQKFRWDCLHLIIIKKINIANLFSNLLKELQKLKFPTDNNLSNP